MAGERGKSSQNNANRIAPEKVRAITSVKNLSGTL